MLSPDVWPPVRAAALLSGQYAVVLIFAYCAVVFSYRIFFHPLRNFPGPKLARVSDIYAGYHAWRQDFSLQTYQSLKKNGPVVRMGPNKLVFYTVEAMKAIYQNSDVMKSSASYHAMQTMAPNTSTFDTVNKSVHREKRQRIGPLLSAKSMRAFETQMQDQIDFLLRNLLEKCQKTPGAPIEIRAPLRRLTLNIVTLLGFGFDPKLQTDTRYQYLIELLQTSNWRFHIYYQVPWIKFEVTEFLVHSYYWLKGGNLHGYITDMIKYRMSLDKDAKQDLYSVMTKQLDAGDSTKKFSLFEIWAEAILFISAGSDTTATSLAAILFYLSQYPECKQKLLRELQATFKSGRDIRAGAELSGCVYLRACIDEAMRTSPGVPGALWREPSSETDKPLIIDGHVIPRGTQVGVSAYALHHNPEYFPDPFSFKPERWLSVDGGDEGATPQANRAAFIPFSTGDRSCAGKAMAHQEIFLVIAKVLWYFDFKVAAESKMKGMEFKVWDTFVGTHDELSLQFYPRGDLWRDLVPE